MANNASHNSKPLDIVLITPTLDGGVGRVFSLLTRGIKESGLSVEVWTIALGAYENETKKWAEITYLPAAHARGLISPLIKLLKEKKPQVILSASFHINCVVIIAKLLSRIKTHLFISEHTSLDTALKTFSIFKSLFIGFCIRLLYKRADRLIAVSQGVAKSVKKYSGVRTEKISVIYNPVITPEMLEMSKEPIDHPFFKNNQPILLAVGRLSIEKDYQNLLEAFSQVNKTRRVNLIIIGGGPEREKIEEKIKTLGLSEQVSLLGNLSNPYPYFVRSDLYILSSTREGLPTTLIEALALGTPIVSTDIQSGPREILNDGEFGTLVPVKNSAALAQAIIEKLKSPKQNISSDTIEKYQYVNAVKNYLQVLFKR